MSCIIDCRGREVLDSRGNPTVEVDIILESGACGRAMVPSGASTGVHEALELRDGDPNRYKGKGVLKAVYNINERIAPEIIEMDASNQVNLDHFLIELDGTENKSNLGANAILGVSMAAARAMTNDRCMPLYKYIGGVNANVLPLPHMNFINGGAHSGNKLDLQEFMIIPTSAPTFMEALRMGSEVFHSLKAILIEDNQVIGVGDEGGFAPEISTSEEALQYLVKAIEKAGYKPGDDIFLAMDAAVSELFHDGKYHLQGAGKSLDSNEMIGYYSDLIDKFPIISIEDPLAEDDWDGWVDLTAELSSKVQIIGDDIYVTNTDRIREGVRSNASTAVLIKLNQIGTLTETVEAVTLAREAGYGVVISHRSGETEDTFIADLAVALNTGQIKAGSVSRSERIAKYNRLLRIEDQLEGAGYLPDKNSIFPHLKFK